MTHLRQATGCIAHALSTPSSAEAGEHTVVCIVRDPRLICDYSLVLGPIPTIKNKLTRWRAPDIGLDPRAIVTALQTEENSMSDFFSGS